MVQKIKPKLSDADVRLQLVFDLLMKHYPYLLLEVKRDPAYQDELFLKGATKLRGSNPSAKHCATPAKAIDAAPKQLPAKWGEIDYERLMKLRGVEFNRAINQAFKERAKFYHFAGFVMGFAKAHNIDLRWGGDWDNDQDFNDQSFDDLVHFELK